MNVSPARAANRRRQVISLVIGDELLGIDLSLIDKVIEPPRFYFVPRSPAFLRGAINDHGRVIAVADLREFMEMERSELTLDSRVLVLASEEYHLGLLVDRVERIESVPLSGPLVQEPEATQAGRYVSKMVNLGGRILNLLDMDKLINEIENYFE